MIWVDEFNSISINPIWSTFATADIYEKELCFPILKTFEKNILNIISMVPINNAGSPKTVSVEQFKCCFSDYKQSKNWRWLNFHWHKKNIHSHLFDLTL